MVDPVALALWNVGDLTADEAAELGAGPWVAFATGQVDGEQAFQSAAHGQLERALRTRPYIDAATAYRQAVEFALLPMLRADADWLVQTPAFSDLPPPRDVLCRALAVRYFVMQRALEWADVLDAIARS